MKQRHVILAGVLLFVLLYSYAPVVFGFEKHIEIPRVFSLKKWRPKPKPTPILSPTNTSTPTSSPTPTDTPTPTHTSSPTPTPTPLPIPRIIPHGNVSFSVSGGSQSGPSISRGSLNPYDPGFGTEQKIQIYTSKSQTDQSLNVTMDTDTGSYTMPMAIVSETTSSYIWEGAWTISDSYLYRYKATLQATGSAGMTQIPIILR